MEAYARDCDRPDYEEPGGAGIIITAILMALAFGAMVLWIESFFARPDIEDVVEPPAVRSDVMPAELRAEEMMRLEDVYWVSNIVGRYNPALTVAERAEIGRAVADWSREYGVPVDLVVAVILVESGGHVYARSTKGARGLMQVMPRWAAPGEDLFVIDTNIRKGVEILADNIRRWGTREGVARYFWGTKKTPDGTYVAKVMQTMEAIGG